MIIKKLQDMLNTHHIRYRHIVHSPAFTAQEIAEVAHESGKEMVKTVMLDVDDQMIMYVLPANKNVHIESMRGALEANHVKLSSENEFQHLFPDCLIGAMPPFGSLYNVKMIVDQSLRNNEWIVFNAGSHHDLIKMRYADYDEIIHPHKYDITGMII